MILHLFQNGSSQSKVVERKQGRQNLPSELEKAKAAPNLLTERLEWPPPLASDSEDNVEVSLPQQSKKRSQHSHVSVELSDIDSDTASKQSVSDRASSSEIEMLDSGSEPVESIAKALFGEVPAIVNMQVADRQKKPAKSLQV
ncbi:hypothetical protein BDR06DRAFT_977010 [Suillus hirtellus]|nr:hypothetical protein BDR06DRAFT_977010 [Suillus hirtellus]